MWIFRWDPRSSSGAGGFLAESGPGRVGGRGFHGEDLLFDETPYRPAEGRHEMVPRRSPVDGPPEEQRGTQPGIEPAGGFFVQERAHPLRSKLKPRHTNNLSSSLFFLSHPRHRKDTRVPVVRIGDGNGDGRRAHPRLYSRFRFTRGRFTSTSGSNKSVAV